VFSEEPEMRFRLTPAAELLRSDVPGSMRVNAMVAGAHWFWRPWGELLHSVKSGETAFEHLYGKNTFDWFKEHPDDARLFDAFHTALTLSNVKPLAAAYDFSRARTIVDVGGGAGALLSAILRAAPSARGVLFDLEHVVAAAKTTADRDTAARCEFVGGDFFKTVPSGGDVYVLKHIIHDWDDDRALTILANCHRAMAGKGKLLLIEELICAPNQPCGAKLGDITMLVRTGGRNRTEKEYRALLTRSGFDVTRVLPGPAGMSLMEAAPDGKRSV
jgi:SAM-dependent methyltransferase